jgi:hypothetical protein
LEDGLKFDGGCVGFNPYLPIDIKLNNIYIAISLENCNIVVEGKYKVLVVVEDYFVVFVSTYLELALLDY